MLEQQDGKAHDESCVSFVAISDTAQGKNGPNARFRVQLCHFWGKNCHSYAAQPLVQAESATGGPLRLGIMARS
jgi:hypothetical protein